MIVTLTAHPSLDKTVDLGIPLEAGRVHIALSQREDAGGKGVNVSRALAEAGVATVAVLPLADDDPYGAVLHGATTQRAQLSAHPVPVDGMARSNMTIVDPAGTTTKVNLPGAEMTVRDASALIEAVVTTCAEAEWLVLAGSLPPGAADDFYVRVIDAVRERYGDASPRIAVDSAGAALRSVVETAQPQLIKPNDDELAELTGLTVPTGGEMKPDDILALADRIVPTHVETALITLGAAGAMFVDGHGAWFGTAPRVRVASTVGAGDSALAGYLVALTAGHSPEDCLRRSIQYGAAAASLPGTQPPNPHDLPTQGIEIHRVR